MPHLGLSTEGETPERTARRARRRRRGPSALRDSFVPGGVPRDLKVKMYPSLLKQNREETKGVPTLPVVGNSHTSCLPSTPIVLVRVHSGSKVLLTHREIRSGKSET